MGTIADLVPLRAENRILVRNGLLISVRVVVVGFKPFFRLVASVLMAKTFEPLTSPLSLALESTLVGDLQMPRYP